MPTLTIRRAADRGLAEHGWLSSRHTFSFADYHDEAHMGFGPLRVINEDKIRGGTGFGVHPHRDMEIISYVIEGSLAHQDSMGNKAVIRPGEVQRMSAGTGITHSEHNNDPQAPAHFLQIWIIPKTRGMAPSYGQQDFTQALAKQPLVLAVSPTGRDGSVVIHQDADMYVGRLSGGARLTHTTRRERGLWIQMIKGALHVQGHDLLAGDGASTSGVDQLELAARGDAEFILFDLAGAW